MILLLENLHQDAHALLAGHAELLLAGGPGDPGGGVPFDRVRAVITRGRGRVDRALIERCPRLTVAARAGVGLDNVDLEAAARRGIRVLYAPGGNTATTAEHTIALLLAVLRRIGVMSRAVAEGRWEDRNTYAGDEARGKTLGIVGFGAIGRRVAEIAGALGMDIVVAGHRGIQAPHPVLPLPELLARADVVTLHLPLRDDTRGLIGAEQLAAMKPGAFLVNTARGALINQKALAEALSGGRLGGFAADVLDAEPPAPDDPLLRSDRVLITPHVAALTAGTYRAVCLLTARNVLAVLRGEAVDPRFVRC